MIPLLPDNISEAVGLGVGEEAVAAALSNSPRLEAPNAPPEIRGAIIQQKTVSAFNENIATLSDHWKVKIWFTEPVTIYIIPYRQKATQEKDGFNGYRIINKKTVTTYVFHGFFRSAYLYYMPRRTGKKGYQFNFHDQIKKWELIFKDKKNNKEFADYESFKKKFDLRFITEDQIKKLWNNTSGQHGGKYNRRDFRKIGPQGLRVMKRFLEKFTNVTEPDTSKYHENQYGTYLSERYRAYHHWGRDISISHNLECPYVHYSSEYQGCGNGRYGLVVNPREFLHLEDD